ncbi:MAG TPA: fibronectin type III domain-containing protein, partial [bacterium]|nr:fibronectin type III domain-containing protein [bacterium]
WTDGKAVETPLDANKKIVIGPFNKSTEVNQVNFIFHYDDGTWEGEDVIPIAKVSVDTTPPAAPQNVTPTAGNGYIDLVWTPNSESDLTGYNVYRSTSPTSNFVKVNGTPITSTYFRNTNLTNGVTYYFVVKAIDNWTTPNESDSSTIVNAQPSATDLFAPLAPRNLQATADVAKIILSWSRNLETDLAGYRIYRSQTSGTNYSLIATINDSTVISFTDTNVVLNQRYYYVMKAFDNSPSQNHSPYSSEVNAMPLNYPVPEAPTNLIATAGNKKIILSWTASQSQQIAGYRIYQLINNNYQLISSDTVTTLNYEVLNLNNGETYTFKVSAVSVYGIESINNPFVTGVPKPLIEVTFILTVDTYAGFNYVRIAGDKLTPMWSADANEMIKFDNLTYYKTFEFEPNTQLQYKYIKATPTNVIWETDFATTSRNREITIIDQGNYKMIVKNIWTNISASTTPIVPQNLSATAGNRIVTLNWSQISSPDIDCINVYRNNSKIASVYSGNSYIDTNVQNNVQYNYYLKAQNKAGIESVASNSVSATPYSTNKNGRISVNTTWSLINSPYIIDGDIIIDTGITLTIEGGAILKFDTNDINNLGNSVNKIEFIILNNAKLITTGNVLFTSNSVNPVKGDWYGIICYNLADTLSNLIVEYAEKGIEFRGSGRIVNSTFRNNNIGIYVTVSDVSVRYCDIFNNDYGIQVTGTNLTPKFNFNNIYNNSQWNIHNSGNTGTIDITNNWWGTNDTTQIKISNVTNAVYQPIRTTSIDITPPAKPQGINVQVFEKYITINWQANNEADLKGYNVYRKKSNEQTFSLVTSTPITTNYYTENNLTANLTYYYQITAIDNSNNESERSAIITVVPYASSGPLENRVIDGDFLDWKYYDVKALDPINDQYNFNDGYDVSRDLIALYSREGTNEYYFRVDFYELGINAELNNVDIYLALDFLPGGQVWLPDFVDCQTDTSTAWELCAIIYNSTNYRLLKSDFTEIPNGITGVKFNSSLDAFEFAISKNVLLNMGWQSGQPLRMQCFTTKDGTYNGLGEIADKPDIVDAIGNTTNWDNGILVGAVSTTATTGRAKFAVIVHGNQSFNPSDNISNWIYDNINLTPNNNPTGYLRTIETHKKYGVPINIHISGCLASALEFAEHQNNNKNGKLFNQIISEIVNNFDSGCLIGGSFAEHIMPYFKDDENNGFFVNSKSIELGTNILKKIYKLTYQPRIFWVPERVINGATFSDILTNHIKNQSTGYVATILDEVTHLKSWFPSDTNPNKIHKINNVITFLINDNADQKKFWNQDNGLHLETRELLLNKAMAQDQEQIVIVFDDWEAYAGKSFGSGVNDNPDNYDKTIRWLANHQWIEIVSLEDILNRNWTPIEHPYNQNLELETYEWLKHACEDSYDKWYYGGTYEQSFFDAVPVLRGIRSGDNKTFISSNKKYGDIKTVGTILRDVLDLIKNAPNNNLKELAYYMYSMMIFETAWHDEDNNNYTKNPDGSWASPDITYDKISEWALRLHGKIRQINIITAAANWANNVRNGIQTETTVVEAIDIDQDSELEYVIRNNKVFAVFENDGGRLVMAFAYDPGLGGILTHGSPLLNSSYEGEEEDNFMRCSSFKDMNENKYVNDLYNITMGTNYLILQSSDNKITKKITLNNNSDVLLAQYNENVDGPLYIRFGLAPNIIDLINNGSANLVEVGSPTGQFYGLKNVTGGQTFITFGNATYNLTSKALPLVTQVEIYGNDTFSFSITINNGDGGYDVIKPTIISATPIDDHTVDILFSEYISKTSAENKNNYYIAKSSDTSQVLSIVSATLQNDLQTVRLITAPQTQNESYVIIVNNIEDRSPVPNTILPNSRVYFNGIGAVLKANVYFLVNDADNIGNYQSAIIMQGSFNPITGAYDPLWNGGIDNLMYDNGTNGDTTANDHIWTISFKLKVSENDTYYWWVGNPTGKFVKSGPSFRVINTDTLYISVKWPDITPPRVVSASSIDNNRVDVIFNEFIDKTTAEQINNYNITTGSNTLAVLAATLDANNTTVHLLTGNQIENQVYSIIVSNVKDIKNNVITQYNQANFTGKGPQDVTPPAIYFVSAISPNQVNVIFTEKVEPVSALTINNYKIFNITNVNDTLTIKEIQLNADGKTVHIYTDTQANKVYKIMISNIKDLATPPNIIIENSFDTFVGIKPIDKVLVT